MFIPTLLDRESFEIDFCSPVLGLKQRVRAIHKNDDKVGDLAMQQRGSLPIPRNIYSLEKNAFQMFYFPPF